MSDCRHEDFRADVDVNRLTRGEGGEVYAYMADVKICCVQCGMPFEFPGFAHGISSIEPRVSINHQTIHLPLKPSDKEHFEFFPGFNVKEIKA